MLLGVPVPASAAPATPAAPCARRELPPPPVDTSEVPKPGEASPTPLPVPAVAVGGPRMAQCHRILPGGAPRPPAPLTADSWMVADLDTGDVLAAQDPHGRQRPASLIKVLLALVVIDELRPDQIVIATKEDASQECTCVAITRGQRYRVEHLLKALLVSSGNDAAHTLGTALGGTAAAVAKMNLLATKLGATDTRAATVSGLDGPGMTSSAYDQALIYRHALRQPRFAKAVATKRLTFRYRVGPPPITLYNDNRLLGTYPGFLGGKTGFTDDARHTYVGAADRDGTRLVVVMMRAEPRPIRVSDQAQQLLDYGFRLASMDLRRVGTLVEPSEEDVVGDAADEDLPAAGVAPTRTGGSGPALALLIAGFALIGIIALRRPGKAT